MAYRPWGLLNWLIPKSGVAANWDLLGCLSTGDRTLAAWQGLKSQGCLGKTTLLRIRNKPSRYDAAILARESERIVEFEGAGGDAADIEAHELLEQQSTIVSVAERFIANAGPNVVLDVSTLPKRFFFPILKLLLKATGTVQNLLVTYSAPIGYTREKLAENFDQWDHLPLFSGGYSTAEPEMMVVNVGFEGFGLQEQVDHGEARLSIKLLVPFPTPPESSRRTWELVRRLKKYRATGSFRTYLTDGRDVGDAFDRLLSLTNAGKRPAILAPFGPKPISVAMCIFATRTESQVFYTQPTVYHPNYSFGVAKVGTDHAVWAYAVRLGGHEYYEI